MKCRNPRCHCNSVPRPRPLPPRQEHTMLEMLHDYLAGTTDRTMGLSEINLRSLYGEPQ